MDDIEIKTFARVSFTPEQRRKIAGIAGYYGMSQEIAISVLAAAAADREGMGDHEIKRILEKAGKKYRENRSQSQKQVKVKQIKKKVGTLVGG